MNRILTVFFVFILLITSCAQKKDYVVTIKTPHGNMVAILYDETPKHKENFIKLAKDHFYDSLLFHRVWQGFMIQGGDPQSKNVQMGQQLGNGGPGYTIPAEFVPKYFHKKGALSAARLGDQQNPERQSSGSQFFIVQGTVLDANALKYDQNKIGVALRKMYENPANKPFFDSLTVLYQAGDMNAYQERIFALVPRIEKASGMTVLNNISPDRLKAYTTIGGSPHLDDQYTVFGQVISGLEVLDKIAAEPRDAADRPLKDIRMTVSVEEMSKKKITKDYGYVYPEEKK